LALGGKQENGTSLKCWRKEVGGGGGVPGRVGGWIEEVMR